MTDRSDLMLPLRVVLDLESDRWIAHCLEFDIIGDGDRPESALECLATAIEIQDEYANECQNPANLLSPTDGEPFRKFAAGREFPIEGIDRSEAFHRLKRASRVISEVAIRIDPKVMATLGSEEHPQVCPPEIVATKAGSCQDAGVGSRWTDGEGRCFSKAIE